MKKFLLTLIAAVCTMAGFAENVVITLNDCGKASDASTALTSTSDFKKYGSATGAEVSISQVVGKVYQSKTGYGWKFGSGSAVGSVTFRLSEPVNAKKIVVSAAKYNNNTCKIIINSTQIAEVTEGFNNYEYEINGEMQEVMVASSSKQMYVSTITIVCDDEEGGEEPTPEKAETSLSFSETEVTYDLASGEEFVAPTLTVEPADAELDIQLTSSNEAVATIVDGAVTIQGVGTTTVTAAFAGDDNYKPSQATYTLQVVNSNSKTVEWIAKDGGKNNAEDWFDANIDAYTKWEATKGGTNNPKYYDGGEGLRIYNGGTFTVTSVKTLQSITLTFSGSGYTFSADNTAVEQTVYPNATSYKWDVSRTCRLQKVTINYAEETAEPVVLVSANELDFGKSLNSFGAKTLTVAGFNLTSAVTWTLSADAKFAVEGELTTEGGELTITCNATEVGTHEATLTLSSEGAEDVVVTLKAEIFELAGEGEGTAESVFNVARAVDFINNGLYDNSTIYYVEGIIVSIDEISTEYGNATYNIADNMVVTRAESDQPTLKVYRGYFAETGDENQKFTSEDQISVGDKVVVCGKLTLYGSTPELAAGNYITSHNGTPTAISTVKAANSNAAYNLAGQRVSAAKAGLYIINGKKVVVK